jgi:outer membrane protein
MESSINPLFITGNAQSPRAYAAKHKGESMKKFLVSVAVAAMAVPMFAQSVPARVAVVDVQKVLGTSTAGKVAYERLKKMQDDRVAKAQALNEEITKLENDINTKKLSLSEDKLIDMQKQLSDKKISMQRYAQDADREVSEARDKTLAELEAKIKPVIDSIGKEMGLAAIFNKFESGLVYASDAIDITDTVIKRFDAASGGPAPAAAKKP